MNNLSRQVFEYRGPRIPERYNQFFNPNICHVCKSRNEGNLITCDCCGLMSYCSQEHNVEHYPEHKEICTSIASILMVSPETSTGKFSNWRQWLLSRENLIRTIEHYNRRPIQNYEKQMIIWSKVCIVCFQRVQLQTCEKCFSVNYCIEHVSVFRAKHREAKCDRLTLSVNIWLGLISNEAQNLSYSFFSSVKTITCTETMLEFYVEYVLMSRKNLDWCTKDYIQSDYLSGPLTVYSGLKRSLCLHIIQQEIVIIYIIGYFFCDELNIAPWEILFHLLPQVRELTVIGIDPKLKYERRIHNLCEHCTIGKRILIFISLPTLHHDVICTNPLYNEPRVAISFHADIYKSDAWLQCIKVVSRKLCPLILTYPNEEKARSQAIKLQQSLENSVEIIFTGRNHFAGLTPKRFAIKNDTMFVNDYVVIYKKNVKLMLMANIAAARTLLQLKTSNF